MTHFLPKPKPLPAGSMLDWDLQSIENKGWNDCLAELQRRLALQPEQVLVSKVALGTVLMALVGLPHQIRELQATRMPEELFKENPINVLIADFYRDGQEASNG